MKYNIVTVGSAGGVFRVSRMEDGVTFLSNGTELMTPLEKKTLTALDLCYPNAPDRTTGAGLPVQHRFPLLELHHEQHIHALFTVELRPLGGAVCDCWFTETIPGTYHISIRSFGQFPAVSLLRHLIQRERAKITQIILAVERSKEDHNMEVSEECTARICLVCEAEVEVELTFAQVFCESCGRLGLCNRCISEVKR